MTPDRVALTYGKENRTYRELTTRVNRLASALRGLGVRRGDRVAYLGPNHPALVETFFAAGALGAVFVPLNTRLAPPELEYVLRDAGAEILLLGEGRDGAGLPGRHVPADGFEDLVASGDPEPLDEPVALDDPCLIMYTSGTTGRPKGAVLTHGNLIWNCYNLLLGVDVTSDEMTLISAPLFHVAALNQTLLPTFLKGGCSVLMPSWEVDACYDLIEEHGITWMFGVTTMFAAFARSPRWPDADLSSLRHLMAGGASVPAALIRTYQERGLVFCQGYGLTETAPGATFLEASQSARKVGSAGVPVFFADVRVVRADGTDAPPGEPGEVLIQGPNVTPGYWRDPDATGAAFTPDGWFHSGDVAVLDEDGHLYIVDRVKDMFISGGENVYPAEVEAAIFEHPAVAEVAVLGVPDAKWGEVGRAFLVLRPGAQVTAGELRDFLRSRLASYKIPVYVDVVDELPKTGSGKIHKPRLRDLPLPVPR